MKASPNPRRIARNLANLGVATMDIDFVPNGHFTYRSNADGNTDSICMSCYLTAATALTLDELRRQELSHLNQCVGNDYAHPVISTADQAAGSR